jgi:outer membrane protein assembly factor BamE (lipoprotein component of BamABCDE complex)
MRKWVLGALAALAFAGAVAAADLPVDKLNGFKAGQTTKAQVLATLGSPITQSHNPDGRSALLYDYSVPQTAANPTVKEMVVGLVFDAHNFLLVVRFYGKTADGAPAPAAPPTPPQPPAPGAPGAL